MKSIKQIASKIKRYVPISIVSITVFFAIFIVQQLGHGEDTITTSKNGLIGLTVYNRPLNEVLHMLSSKVPLEIKGSLITGEPVTINISDVSLEEALKRLMRGYNYVVIKPEGSNKQILMVLGRAERTKYVETPAQSLRVPPTTTSQPSGPPQPPVITKQPAATQPAIPTQQPSMQQPSMQTGFHQSTTSNDPTIPPMPQVPGFSISPDLLPPMPPGMSGLPSAVRIRSTTSPDMIPPQIPSISSSTGTGTPSSTGTTTSTSSIQAQPATSTNTILPPSIPTSDTSTSTATTTQEPAKKEAPDLRPPSIPGM